jgi:hypothetical protein
MVISSEYPVSEGIICKNLWRYPVKNDDKKIRITWDDIEQVEDTDLSSEEILDGNSWGTVATHPVSVGETGTSGGSFLFKGWFYLGVAGLLGAFLAWIICEPSLIDDISDNGWGNVLIIPMVITFICISLGTVESIVERSWKRALLQCLASIGLGIILGFIFKFIASIIFNLLIGWLASNSTDLTLIVKNPFFWMFRALAWSVFGIAGGLIFGIVSKSGKKIYYGMLGGLIGACIGGFLFDPICLMTQGGEVSRAIGFSIMGASTGIAIGLVESVLKERWLYVVSGPLAGKQFVLYQDIVNMGKDQSNTIYLFKDPSILDHHASIQRRAGRSVLTAIGPVIISGQTILPRKQRILNSGDVLQIGRYTFSYAEKKQSSSNP